jgi:hypothetical protein
MIRWNARAIGVEKLGVVGHHGNLFFLFFFASVVGKKI